MHLVDAPRHAMRAILGALPQAPGLEAGRTVRALSMSALNGQPEGNGKSSTRALEYKDQRPVHRPLPPLPTIEPPRMKASEAVGNILYNTPEPNNSPLTRHTLTALVQDEPGVLSRVSGALAARGFNIDSLVVCTTEVPELSRMCLVLKGQAAVIEQVRRQLEDLVPVWAVLDHTHTRTIERELLLARVSLLGPEYFQVQADLGAAPTAPFDSGVQEEQGFAPARPPGPAAGQRLSPTDALRIKGEHMRHVITLAQQFQGRIVDVSPDSVIVEMSGKPSRCDALLKLLRPFGIIECARSGTVVLPRAPQSDESDLATPELVPVDASLLPPG